MPICAQDRERTLRNSPTPTVRDAPVAGHGRGGANRSPGPRTNSSASSRFYNRRAQNPRMDRADRRDPPGRGRDPHRFRRGFIREIYPVADLESSERRRSRKRQMPIEGKGLHHARRGCVPLPFQRLNWRAPADCISAMCFGATSPARRAGHAPSLLIIELLVVIPASSRCCSLPSGHKGHRETAEPSVPGCVLRQIQAAAHLYVNSNRDNLLRDIPSGRRRNRTAEHFLGSTFRPSFDERCSPPVTTSAISSRWRHYYRCPSVRMSSQPIHYISNGFAFRQPGEVDRRGAVDRSSDAARPRITVVHVHAPCPSLPTTRRQLFKVWKSLGSSDMSLSQCLRRVASTTPRPVGRSYQSRPVGGGTNAISRRQQRGFFDAHVAIVKPVLSNPKHGMTEVSIQAVDARSCGLCSFTTKTDWNTKNALSKQSESEN